MKSQYLHELVEAVISVLDARDPYTYEHSERVALLSELIARKMNLDKSEIELIHVAAHLHDIGKVGVPDFILNKEGPLTKNEYNIMKSHSRLGYNIVKKIKLLEKTGPYILHHHERWDGKGYPNRLKGENIPPGSRVIAVADTFDTITSNRSYKKAFSINDAILEIERVRGTQLCPMAVDSFLSFKDELPEILEELNRGIKHQAFLDEADSLKLRSKILV